MQEKHRAQWICLALVALLAFPRSAAAASDSDSAGADTYVVQVGDTLSTVSQITGVGADVLIALNQLSDPDAIVAGTTLRLSPSAAVPQAATMLSGQSATSAAAPIPPLNASQTTLMTRPALLASATPTAAIPVPLTVGRPMASAAAPAPVPTPAPSLSMRSPSGTPLTIIVHLDQDPGALTSAALPATVQIALQYTGSQYEYGGTDPSGFDCSGFVYFVESRAGRSIPRDLLGQYNSGSHPAVLQPGDVVFFQNTYDAGLSHNGIYLGDGKFIHAADEAAGVAISSLTDAYYQEHWYGATRLS